MSFIDEQIAEISNNSTRIVYPEGNEPNMIRAAAELVRSGIATPILIGSQAEISRVAGETGTQLDGIEIVCPDEFPRYQEFSEMLASETGLPVVAGEMLLKTPLYFGAMMVKAGEGDCLVAGIATETAEVVAAGKMIIGMEKGMNTPSCISVAEIPDYEGTEGNLLVFSDTAINVDPTAEELADIAIASAHSVKAILGWEPRVAMLSFSTCGSAGHERAQKVADAVLIAKRREPELLIDGEMQLDTAIIPDVAKRKFTHPSPVAGRANILIFPNLDAGNIGVKLLQRLAKAHINGGMLQGFASPICDITRGGTAENIIRNSVMAIRLFQAKQQYNE